MKQVIIFIVLAIGFGYSVISMTQGLNTVKPNVYKIVSEVYGARTIASRH